MKINNVGYNLNNVPERNNNLRNKTNPSFKGVVPAPVINGLSNFYTNVAKTNPFQKFIKGFSRSNNTFTHLMVAESVLLSGFYMINTLRNKKIEKEQKPQMLINDTLTLGVSAAGAYLVEDKITNAVMKGAEKYFSGHKDFYVKLGEKAAKAGKDDLLGKVAEVAGKKGSEFTEGLEQVASKMGSQLKNIVGEEGKLKAFQITGDKLSSVQSAVKESITQNAGNAEKAKEAVKGLVDDVYNASAARGEADKILPGINKLKVIIILGIIYRFIGPVVITPIANKISSKFFAKKEEKDNKTENKK